MLSCPHTYLLQTYMNIDMILQYQCHIKRHFMLLENLFRGVADNSPDWPYFNY